MKKLIKVKNIYKYYLFSLKVCVNSKLHELSVYAVG